MRRVGVSTLWGRKGTLLYSQNKGSQSFRVYDFGKMDYRQDFTQRLYTYPKEVLSCVLNPDLISNETINPDARMRARFILDNITSAGCYSQSAGFAFIRKSVCEHIARVDCVPEPAISTIILTDGISQGMHLIIRSIISQRNDAIMVPTPRYPFYTANISQNQGQAVPYQLDRQDGWQVKEQDLEDQYQLSRKSGKSIKAIIVNNSSNPTGATLNTKSLRQLLTFAVKHRLLVIADEAYADPLRTKISSFVSCRKFLQTLNPEIRGNCELVSLYSVSKGMLMQGGYRGGYLSLHNIDPEVFKQLAKFQTFYGCSGVMGQLLIELITNPFFCASETTKSCFQAEHASLLNLLKSNGKLVKEALSVMTNVRCNIGEQAIYAYPQVNFSKKALEAAKEKGMNIDAFYCKQMLKNTGTALVPGSYFSQSSASHHFRLPLMILPSKQLETFLSKLKQSNDHFHRKSQY